jgi:hypothetical protein
MRHNTDIKGWLSHAGIDPNPERFRMGLVAPVLELKEAVGIMAATPRRKSWCRYRVFCVPQGPAGVAP